MPDATSFRSPGRGGWSRTAACLLVLITAGCSGAGNSMVKGLPPPSEFAGDWIMSEGTPESSCQVDPLSLSCPTPIRVEDTFGGLLVKIHDRGLPATVSDGVVSMTDVSPTYTKSWTGVLGTDGRVTGEWALTLTGMGPAPDCTSRGKFTWNRCPDSGCEQVYCLY